VLCAQRPTQPWELQSGGSSAPTESPIGQPRRHHSRLPPAHDAGRVPSPTDRRHPGGHEGAVTTTAAAAAAARCVRLLPTSRCTGAAAAARSDEPSLRSPPSGAWLIARQRRPRPRAAAQRRRPSSLRRRRQMMRRRADGPPQRRPRWSSRGRQPRRSPSPRIWYVACICLRLLLYGYGWFMISMY
jgi:hypothetical protein